MANNIAVGKWTILTVCIITILLSALVAPYMNRLTRISEGYQNASGVPQEDLVNQEDAASQLPDDQPLQSRRASLIKHIISTVLLTSQYPEMTQIRRNELATIVNDAIATQHLTIKSLASFDTLCGQYNISDPKIKQKLETSCKQFYLDNFAKRETALYPTFDAACTESIDTSFSHDNSLFLIDQNEYKIIKNSYTPRVVVYDFDAMNALVRANFKDSLPTYFILSAPMAIEYEQFGYFNVVYDVNPDFNIMNYYHTDEDNSNRFLYMFSTPPQDTAGNKLNYMEANFALSQAASTLNSSTQFKQLKVFYMDFNRAGVNNDVNHTMTVHITPASQGTLTASYSGSRQLFVDQVSITTNGKDVTLTVDSTLYTDFLAPITEIMKSNDTKHFDLFFTFSFNIITAYLMYKKQGSPEHHLLMTRTPLMTQTHDEPLMKIFAFDTSLSNPSSYGNNNNDTINRMLHIPNMLRVSQQMGYAFKA